MTETIGHRAVRGSMFIGASTASVKVISIITTIYLARVLDPADFGLFGLGTVIVAYVGFFASLGIPSAVIQNPNDAGRVGYHGFVATTAIGSISALALLFAAPFLEQALETPGIDAILRWLALSLFLESLFKIPEALLQRDLLFGRVGVSTVVPEIFYLASGVALAAAGYGVWSLVAATLVRSGVRVVLYWSLCPGRAWFSRQPWDWRLMASLSRYGVQLTAGGFTHLFNSTIGNILVGKYLGTSALGYYAKAYDFANTAIGNLSSIIGSVLFPSYSRMQSDRDRLRTAYLRSIRIISVVLLPLAVGTILVVPDLIPLLIGWKWVPMVVPLQIMCGVFILISFSMTASTIFQATGNPKFNLQAGMVVSAVMLPLLVAALSTGIVAVAASVLVAHVAGLAYNVGKLNRVLGCSAMQLWKSLVPGVTSSATMGVAAFLAKITYTIIVSTDHGAGGVTVIILVGCLSYFLILKVFYFQLLTEILALMRGSLSPKGRGAK